MRQSNAVRPGHVRPKQFNLTYNLHGTGWPHFAQVTCITETLSAGDTFLQTPRHLAWPFHKPSPCPLLSSMSSFSGHQSVIDDPFVVVKVGLLAESLLFATAVHLTSSATRTALALHVPEPYMVGVFYGKRVQ